MTREADDAELVAAIARRLAAVDDKGEPHRGLARAWDDWERLRPGPATTLLEAIRAHAAAGCDFCHFSLVLHPANPLDVPAVARLELLDVEEALAERRAEILDWNVREIAPHRPPPAKEDDDGFRIANLSGVEGVRWAIFFTRGDADEAAVVLEIERLTAEARWAAHRLPQGRARELVAAAAPLSTPGLVLVEENTAWLIQLDTPGGSPAERAVRLTTAAQSCVVAGFGSATRTAAERAHGVSISRIP